LRLAQIVWDTQFDGVPIAFAWPSRGRIRSYPYDRESAIFSHSGFIELLRTLRSQPRISQIHIIAHSMGNQIVLQALELLAASGATRQVKELIFAAPDVDRGTFEALGPVITASATGVTLYASAADKALIASHGFAEGYRAGDVPEIGPVVMDGIETIDITAIGNVLFDLNHATFAQQRSLLNDIKRLLQTGDHPPNLRMGEIRGMPEGVTPPQWWQFPR
jgi:esterase/lipase superfamily enzyme